MSYEIIKELNSFRDITAIFREAEEGENLLILSTGGWHGSHKTLDDCERIIKDRDEEWTKDGAYVTVFIFNPKEVSLSWGEIHIRNQNEVDWLRSKVKESLDLLPISQEGNK